MSIDPAYDPSAPLPAARDFYRLRSEGIGRIAESSGAVWTDYNTHDPGISILEALAFAITELSYRTGFPIEDILASAAVSAGASADDPYPDQAFFNARRILTVNPTTPEDLRRLLIDVAAVRNAWMQCEPCGCATTFYGWCEAGELVFSYDTSQRRDQQTPVMTVEPRGLYHVLLELEEHPELGDLNDRKIVRRRVVTDEEGRPHTLTAELRFPVWGPARRDQRQVFAKDPLSAPPVVSGPTRTTKGTTPVDDVELRRHWFDVFYVDYALTLADGTAITIENASLRVFGDGAVRARAEVPKLLEWLGDDGPDGFVEPYRRKVSLADTAIDAAKSTLESHRSLDEDWGCVDLVEIADVAGCAEVEVDAAADIDRVQAEIWFRLERYLDPPVDFASLDDLRASGAEPEMIFNGPALENGFLTEKVLRETDLRAQLRVSDILNLLMDIDGVVSIDGLLLTAYDRDGRPIRGISDPKWEKSGPVFDPARSSASWLMALSREQRPRLHRNLSRFAFSSGGLPFTPRLDEAEDTLVQLRGQAARPKLPAAALDIRTPMGKPRDLDAYQPVQHSFPGVYGIGPAGLASTATKERKAQAKQLKAYLMVFEQLLRNAYAQLAHSPDLFSLDRGIDRTYFAATLNDAGIVGYEEIVNDTELTADALARLVESRAEFQERRNGFLDHLLARFGERFADYAMVLTDLEGQTRAGEDLIRDKLAYLRAVPELGHDRGRAFNRRIAPSDPDNAPGLRQRINLLLGLPDWTIVYRAAADGAGYRQFLTIDELGEQIITLTLPASVGTALDAVIAARWPGGAPGNWTVRGAVGSLTLTTTIDGRTTREELLGPGALDAALLLGRTLAALQRTILAAAVVRDQHHPELLGSRWRVALMDRDGNRIGTSDRHFVTRQAALGFIGLMAGWAAHQRAVVVEHLLLRPKFPGDALYAACSDAGCGCGDEDPYSFRLTYVMPGWTEPFSSNMQMRGYADRTIQEHTPAHLMVKTCWVGNDGYLADPCDPVIDDITQVIAPHAPDEHDSCTCAAQVHAAYAEAFGDWMADNTLLRQGPDALALTLAPVLAGVDLAEVACAAPLDAAMRTEIEAVLSPHFVQIALHGHQFERFEDAWCAWVDADALIDWTGEHLHDTVRELLAAGAAADVSDNALCGCATEILQQFGSSFRRWQDAGLAAGIPLESFAAFDPPTPTPCASLAIAPGVTEHIRDVLLERYSRYTEVSYRLALLVEALGELRNTYPRATLHDCDEGSDFNPVRLGHTALGSY
jgi:hypothetical protein